MFLFLNVSEQLCVISQSPFICEDFFVLCWFQRALLRFCLRGVSTLYLPLKKLILHVCYSEAERKEEAKKRLEKRLEKMENT